MKTLRLCAAIVCVCICQTAWANNADIDGRKGIGYAAAIGGPSGLSLNLGIGNFIIEGIAGASRYTDGDSTVDPITFVDAAVGAHLRFLRAQNVALTIGARFNIGTGSVADTDASNSGGRIPVTQIGADVPLRIYWFPDRHISIHTEFGLSVLMGPADAVLYQDARSNEPGLTPEGLVVHVFRDDAPIGQLGLTFWW